MSSPFPRVAPFLVCAALCVVHAQAAKVTADVAPPQRREAVVETAERLTNRPSPAAVPAELASPFNPANFDQADRAGEAGARATPGTTAAAGPVEPAKPAGDREILETLAARLTPSGMIAMGGRPLLIIDRNRFEVGTKFIVTYNEQDYELELAAIDRTNFTLRYRGEEITRPIKPVSK